jgi:hypothetical protein
MVIFGPRVPTFPFKVDESSLLCWFNPEEPKSL